MAKVRIGGPETVLANLRVVGQQMNDLPVGLPTHTVASVPAAASHTGRLIYVSNGAAGSPVVAFSNGTNWLRVDTLAAIS